MYISEIISNVIGFDWYRDTLASVSIVTMLVVITIIFLILFPKASTNMAKFIAIFILSGGYIAEFVIGGSLKYSLKSPAYDNIERNVTVSGVGTIKKKGLETSDTIYTVDSKLIGGFKIEKPVKYPTYFIWPKSIQTNSVTVDDLYLTNEQAKAIDQYRAGQTVYIKLSGTGRVLEVRSVN